MSEPVLVVHGVANHTLEPFLETVNSLSERLNHRYNLIPVFWGDLGAQSTLVADTVPALADNVVRSIEAPVTDFLDAPTDGRGIVRAGSRQDLIVQGAAEAREADDRGVRAGEDPGLQAIREAVQEALPSTRYLNSANDPQLLRAVGRAIGAATRNSADASDEQAGRSELVRSFGLGDALSGIKNVAKAVLSEIDNVVGVAVGNALGQVNQTLRTQYGPNIVNFLGDIFVYQRRQAALQQRIWDAIAAHAPGRGTSLDTAISVLAHSLGGVVSFDAATSGTPRLFIKHFITFGSQAAFFDVLDPRPTLAPYSHDEPVNLPDSIGTWTNLWEPLDILAFSAGNVFTLASGQSPTDVLVRHLASYGLYTHSIYWQTPELAQAISEALGG